jgi:aspartate/methionine/tyrosine aminotransferase
MTAISAHPIALRSTLSFDGDRFLMFVVDELAYRLEQSQHDVIRLTLGKSEDPPAAEIVEAMLAAAADYSKASLVFPAGLPHLRARLAREYAQRHGVEQPPDQFVVSAGTSTMFRNLYQLLVGEGDEVLVPLPYYPLYVFTAKLAGARVTYYRVDPASSTVDLDSLASSFTERTRVVVVNSPGNPLGNIVDRADLLAIDQIIAGRAVLVSDEIYANMGFDAPGFSALECSSQLRTPVVVTNGFSKAHRMYARRVGYAVVPPELVEPLTVIQQHTLLTTDPVAQFGAIAALDHPDGVTELRQRYRERRDETMRRFAPVGSVVALPSAGGFYHTLDCAAYLREHDVPDTLALATRILESVQVATVPGGDFGLPGTLRLSYSSSRYEEAIDRLVAFFG